MAWILSNYTEDEEIIAAALLHDVLEDVKGYSFDDLARDFNPRVAELVKEVSEDKDPNIEEDAKATWERRKQNYLDNLCDDSQGALMICAADKIHNIRSTIQGYDEYGEKFWDFFNSPAERRIWFYDEIYAILLPRLDSPIVLVLKNELERLKEYLAYTKT